MVRHQFGVRVRKALKRAAKDPTVFAVILVGQVQPTFEQLANPLPILSSPPDSFPQFQDEARAGTVTVRNMLTFQQNTVPVDRVCDLVRTSLDRYQQWNEGNAEQKLELATD